jgi:type IV pilus assembly protein PilB
VSAAPARKLIGQVLKEMGDVTEGRIQEALALQRQKGGLLGEILVGMGVVSRQKLLLALGKQAGMEVVDLSKMELAHEVVAAVDPSTATVYRLVPIRREEGVLTVALADPLNAGVLDDLRFLLGCDVRGAVAPEEQVDKAIQRFYAEGFESARKAVREEAGKPVQVSVDLSKVDLTDKEAMAKSPPIVKLLNYILYQAIRDRASDIHLEPFEKEFKIRYRLDGVLYELEAPQKALAEALISRVKVMADLDIAETRVPQDGRIELSIGGRPVDIRVSTLPTMFGESCVMRVLDRSNVSLDLARLGLRERDLKVIRALMKKPHGIVLVTGPTGSGKTTTLYSVLQEANDVSVKIITTEDPVEYDLDGIVQVQINEEIGLTYASCLRSILRQDPDVILVGEIRDLETAQIAVEASLTGHLVFSTLHTNSAPETITRLLDMDIDPFNFADALLGIMAQRLVRTLCKDCKEEYSPSQEEFAELMEEYGVESWDTLGIRYSPAFKLFRPKGCAKCGKTGYKGRMGIHELLVATDEIKRRIQKREPIEELRKQAMRDGMTTLLQDGIQKVVRGFTDFKQVRAVCMK